MSGGAPGLTAVFPRPERLAGGNLAHLGMPAARAASMSRQASPTYRQRPGSLPATAQAILAARLPGLVRPERTITIPASLAYGSTGYGSVPANAAIVFDVELTAVK